MANSARPVNGPMGTVTGGGIHHGVVEAPEALHVRNYSGGDESYIVVGNKRERVRQYGQAVTPPVLRWIVGRIVEGLEGGR